MALQLVITPGELERQARLAFEGKQARVFLCSDPTGSLKSTDPISYFREFALKDGEGGYGDWTGTILPGAWSPTRTRYELPPLMAQFQGREQGFSYDTLVVQIGDNDYPHSVVRSSEVIQIRAAQVQTYRILLIHDD